MAEQSAAAALSNLLSVVAPQSTTSKAAGAASGTTSKGTGATAKGAGSNKKGTSNTKKGTSNTKKGTGATNKGSGNAAKVTGSSNKGASNTTKGTGANKKTTGSTTKGSSTTGKEASTTDKVTSTTDKGASTTDKGASTTDKGASITDKGASTSNKGTNDNGASTSKKETKKMVKGATIVNKETTKMGKGATTVNKATNKMSKGATTVNKVTSTTDKVGKATTSQKKIITGPAFVTRKTTCPFNSSDWQNAGHMPGAAARAKRDIASLYSQPVPGVFFVPDEDNLMCVRAMIVGNFDTPYEGGFFHFYTRFGPQYPFEPPRVCAMSCYRFGHKVRFNPNMYEDGTVCLSILGTWSGPAWTAANSLMGVLLSIQSLFCDQALCNEPGYANLRDTGDKNVEFYDVYVRHETLRVAVIHTIEFAEDYKIPPELIKVMKCSFMEYFNSYVASCETYRKYDKKKFNISLISSQEFVPNFTKLEADLNKLHSMLTKEEAVKGKFGPDNKFIKDNTLLACPSSESSLSEFSDTDIQTTPTKPSDSKITAAQLPIASSASSKKDLLKNKDLPVSVSSSSEDSVGEASKSGSRQKNKLKSLKSGGLANMVQSLVSNIKTLGTGSPTADRNKAKSVNTKVANAVKIDSAYCEKILKEVAVQDGAENPSYDSNIEQCLDFMSFMAESESEYEELSDSDQFSESEEEDKGKDTEQSTDEKLSSPADRDAGAGSTAGSSSSPDLSTQSNKIAMEVDETVDSHCAASKLSKDMEVCDDDCSSSDSSGRGCKRECSGVIKAGRAEDERGSSSSPQ